MHSWYDLLVRFWQSKLRATNMSVSIIKHTFLLCYQMLNNHISHVVPKGISICNKNIKHTCKSLNNCLLINNYFLQQTEAIVKYTYYK